MKKITTALLLVALLLCGCGADAEPEQAAESISEATTGTTTQTTAATTAEATTQMPTTNKSTKTEETEKTETITATESTTETTTEPPADNRIISDGSETEQGDFLTDPVPEGLPMPVEPEDAVIDENKAMTCTFSIDCSTILDNPDDLDPDKLDILPADGIIFPASEVEFHEGESVFDVLQRICTENRIHMEFSWTPLYNTAYIEGIGNIYEFDCGSMSGWKYSVNGWFPNYGCSRYQLTDGEVVEFRYTCDLGNDIELTEGTW